MRKSTCSVLLVITLLAAPGVALGAMPDCEAAGRPSLIEWVWSGVARLLGIDGETAPEVNRETERPHSIGMNDEGGGCIDPNG